MWNLNLKNFKKYVYITSRMVEESVYDLRIWLPVIENLIYR